MIRKIILGGAILGLLAACAEENNELNYQDEYLGTWDVTEKTGVNAPQIYTVQIQAGSNEEEIIINGLYNLPNVAVRAEIDGHLISIPAQTSDGIDFAGSGSANADFNQLNIDFTADDGSGEDVIEAVLLR